MKRTFRLALVAMAVLAIAGVAIAAPASAGCGSKSCTPAQAAAAKADAKTAADCAAKCAEAGKTCTPAQVAACAAKADAKTTADCAAKCAAAGKTCTPAQAAACAAKAEMAAASDCSYCGFMTDLNTKADQVKFSTKETKSGVVVMFTAVHKQDVAAAKAMAVKAYDMMSKPAACAVTKAKMAEASCAGCKTGLDAFANSTVTMEETKDGSKALVSTDDEKTVEKLHTFFRALQGHGAKG